MRCIEVAGELSGKRVEPRPLIGNVRGGRGEAGKAAGGRGDRAAGREREGEPPVSGNGKACRCRSRSIENYRVSASGEGEGDRALGVETGRDGQRLRNRIDQPVALVEQARLVRCAFARAPQRVVDPGQSGDIGVELAGLAACRRRDAVGRGGKLPRAVAERSGGLIDRGEKCRSRGKVCRVA